MRKALDVCRRAVEMVEADIRKQRVLGSPGMYLAQFVLMLYAYPIVGTHKVGLIWLLI